MDEVIIAEDDDELFLVAGEALAEAGLSARATRVRDGAELLDLLRRRGPYLGRPERPLPRLILLDIEMPRMDGRQALKELKADPLLRLIPIVVFTGLFSESEVSQAYGSGANSFVAKPLDYSGFLSVFQAVREFWLDGCVLPAVG